MAKGTKKPLLLLACLLLAVLLGGCGREERQSEYEQQKIDQAIQISRDQFIPLFDNLSTGDNAQGIEDYTGEELAYMLEQQSGLQVEGEAVKSGITSFQLAKKEVGAIVDFGEAEAYVDEDAIVVRVDVKGEKKEAYVEVILSNDMFFRLQSAALNPVSTLGEKLERAALDTVIGMGTVFAVLILISFVIHMLGYVPKLLGAKPQTQAAPKAAPAPAVAPAKTEVVSQQSGEDDGELAAAIVAAIVAYRSAEQADGPAVVPADGFIVRSIRRRSRR